MEKVLHFSAVDCMRVISLVVQIYLFSSLLLFQNHYCCDFMTILYHLIIYQNVFLFCFSYCSDLITVDGKRVISPAHILIKRLISRSNFFLDLMFPKSFLLKCFIEDGEKNKRVISWEISKTDSLSLKDICRKYDYILIDYLSEYILVLLLLLYRFHYCGW